MVFFFFGPVLFLGFLLVDFGVARESYAFGYGRAARHS